MYKFLSTNGNSFAVKNTETQEIVTLSTDVKIDHFFEKNIENISEECLISILDGLRDNENIESFNNTLTLGIEYQVMSRENLFDYVGKNHEMLNSDTAKCFLRIGLKKENLINKFYEQHKEALNKSFQAAIIAYSGDNKKILSFLKQNPNVSTKDKEILLPNLNASTMLNLYKKNKYDVQNIIAPANMFLQVSNYLGENEAIKFIKKQCKNNVNAFPIEILERVAKKRGKLQKTILSVLDKNQNDLDFNQLSFLIQNSSHKKQKEYYQKNEHRLDDVQKYAILSSIKDNKNSIEIEKKMQELRLSQKSLKLVDKVCKNFGINSLTNKNANQFILQAESTFFNDDTIYQLFKYFVYTNTMPDMSKVIEEQELFERFQEFRKQEVTQNLMDVVNTRDTLTNFNNHNNLIKECIETGLTEREKFQFVSVLNDKHVKVDNKEDLQNYPHKRSEYIDELIEFDYDYAMVYMLTGLDYEEYLQKEKMYFSDEQLNTALNDFSEELQEEIEMMQIAKEIISKFESESWEYKDRVLKQLKNDLEKEFTSQGSYVAKIRKNFSGFETNLRALYGKELQNSLTEMQLPLPEKDKGVDVISLNGEEFKILVHGLNAYGQGSQSYQHRDRGLAYICTSLISNNKMGRADAEIYYGFKNISNKSLVLEGPDDIYSHSGINSLDISAERNTMFLKTDELLRQTDGRYNEIVLYRDQIDEFGNVQPIQPDYIIAFSEISEYDREEAKKLGIPIVLINEKIYEQQTQQAEERSREEELIEEQILEQESITQSEQEIFSKDAAELRERMLHIIKEAKDNCTAIQQEAIMAEMQKEFKLGKQKQEESEHMEAINV